MTTPYHVPVFTNHYVTVLNVFIPPQRTSGLHRHPHDSFEVLITGTELKVERPDTAARVSPPRPRGTTGFSFHSRQPAEHAVTVTGDTPFTTSSWR